MATVRFSNELKATIKSRASALFDDRVVAARESYDPSWGDEIYRKLFSPYTELMDKFPAGAFPTVEKVWISGASFNGVSLYFCPPDLLPLSRPGKTFMLASAYDSNWDAFGVNMLSVMASTLYVELDLNDSRWDVLGPELQKYSARVQEICTERDTTVQDVGALLERFATLAPALKEWPALWELLPEETKERHREGKQRKKPEQDQDAPQVDLTRLTSTIVKNRVTR